MTHQPRTFPRSRPVVLFPARLLRPALALPLLLSMTSCLPLPLGDPQTSQVDKRLAGLWTAAGENGQKTGVMIAPFDAHAYMIQMAEYVKAGDKYQSESMMMFKAWLVDVKGSGFIVCQPAAFLAGGEAADRTVYLTYRFTLEGDVLKAKMVNEDYPKFKELHDSAALAKVIEENLDDPKMYRDNVLELHRVNLKDDANKDLGRLFGT